MTRDGLLNLAGACDPETAQHWKALRIANEIRLARADGRRRIAAGSLTVADALDLPEFQSCTVERVLTALPGVGRNRAGVMLREAGISNTRIVGALTAHQRVELLAAVADRHRRSQCGLRCRECDHAMGTPSMTGLCGFCEREAAA